MFTPEKLLDMAIEAREKYEARENMSDNHRLAENAMICAEWMDLNGITGKANIGPFNTHDIKRGDTVRIKRGSEIRGYGLGAPARIAKRSYAVMVHRVSCGHANRDFPSNECVVTNAEVTWSGSNGWKWTDVNNVEKL